ncbi:hypothetical protein ACFVQ3_08795 [Oerskovia sp. NPDC057915]|uniref:hypothetical protein n=1 Tax=Oerskovia sp. NPDC057915 TaxID=3346280 RepID=UPI0036DF4461
MRAPPVLGGAVVHPRQTIPPTSAADDGHGVSASPEQASPELRGAVRVRSGDRPDEAPRRDLLRALPTGVLGLLWFLWGAGAHPLQGDEYATWHAASLDVDGLGRLIAHKDLVQAPYYAVIHVWIDAFGDSELSLRMPSVLALAAATYLVTVLGFRLADRASGYVAAVLFVLVPSMTDLAQFARGYALAVLLTVAATLAFLAARRTGRAWRWGVYGLLLVLLAAAHLLALSVVVAHAALLLRRGTPRSVRLAFWTVVGAVAVLLVPAVWWAHGQADLMLSWNVVTEESLRSYAYQLVHSRAAATGLAVFAGMGVLVLARRPDRGPLVLLLSWALLPPVVLLLASWSAPLFYYRYLQFTVPAITLLAGIGLVGGLRELSGRRTAWALPAVALVLCATAWSVWGDQRWARSADRSDRPDVAGASEVVLDRSAPGDVVVFGDQGDRTRTPFDHAARDRAQRPRDVLVERTGAVSGWFGATECGQPVECLGDPARIWLMNLPAADDPLSGLDPDLRLHLVEGYRIVQRWDLTGTQVVELVPKDPAGGAGSG